MSLNYENVTEPGRKGSALKKNYSIAKLDFALHGISFVRICNLVLFRRV